MKIYTKQGDSGQTALFDGRRVAKDDLRIETYGTVDELNSELGMCVVACRHAEIRAVLVTLQQELFVLGSDLATPVGSPASAKIRRIGEAQITCLEQQIDAATAKLPPLQHFILPGGSALGANLHVARTVCRRAERALVRLLHEAGAAAVGPWPLVYLNRLSDLLFVLARRANQLEGVEDVVWERHF